MSQRGKLRFASDAGMVRAGHGEIGMTRATGKPYVHMRELLGAATREVGSAGATVS